jgi:hypothetical protein
MQGRTTIMKLTGVLVGAGIGYVAGNEQARHRFTAWMDRARTSGPMKDLENRAADEWHRRTGTTATNSAASDDQSSPSSRSAASGDDAKSHKGSNAGTKSATSASRAAS